MEVQAEHEDARWVCGKHQACALTCRGNELGEAVRKLVVKDQCLISNSVSYGPKNICLFDCLKAKL